MSDKPETSADITAEIRARAGAWPEPALTKYDMTLADRIDAAVKRECIEAATRAATQGVKLTNEKHANMPIGNTAAMHDALVAVKKLFAGRLMFQPAIREAHRAVIAALAFPARNCDRFGGDIDRLREACLRERGLNPEEDFPEVFGEWLLELAGKRGAV